MTIPSLRIARPVSDLARSSALYCAGAGLSQLGEFSQHQGFSGIMLGYPDAGWHLELTFSHPHPVTPQPSPEDLLVLYQPNPEKWQWQCEQMLLAGFNPIAAFNPYRDQQGRTFIDPDGYRTVIQCHRWPVS